VKIETDVTMHLVCDEY